MIVDLPNNTGNDSWFIGNIRHSGWYRLNYEQENWRLLRDQLKMNHTLIHPVHRAQILDDSFNLGRAEIVNQTLFFDLSKYLINETDPLAFTPAFAGLVYMNNFIQDDSYVSDMYKVSDKSY